ncbi:MAG: MotA/TolQ/ExbB proton channel family protein [Phenylobacterium sp.]|jgi:biopolymer transport protein TolQ|uniref:protein TolQ n=1 Tax=Phenylobacterium sp. TaxID=1871053 RepID=UPI0026112B8A|nr:protein TolQ [Phenylobacterium sp.]MDB5437031.1 MotA/TolQ/ExbB proton channel family protein [Phenylobacterium sp.]MDB5464486.1 MotA/TolQ/ExbB proton channel family protein [Phenylobacterium sp.]MDB5497918.1 MotA/TolQ/ExbB proton channel family protein [Phenylobacterium sp.]
MDSAAVTPESFNFVVLFMRADWVVKLVMLGLALASLWSWTVILDKTFRFAALNREANRFEDEVASGKSLEEVAAKEGERPRHALPRMLQGALREWREARTKGLATDTQTAFLIQRIDRVLDAAIARESARVEDGLGSLAIVATASPFVGLFGTVWGIMHAFQSIAIQKNTSLAVVAPSIAEALFATAIGLIAAIPAYIAFNKFSTDAAKFAGRLEGFADDLSTAIQRRLAERG